MRQGLQRRAEPVLHPACAIRYTAHLSAVAAEEGDDPISLSKRVSLQYNRVALMKRHASFATCEISTPEGADASQHSLYGRGRTGFERDGYRVRGASVSDAKYENTRYYRSDRTRRTGGYCAD